MSRIDAISPEEATGQLADAYREVERIFGRVSNMYRTVAHVSEIVGDLANLSRHFGIDTEGPLDHALLRLVQVRVSKMNDCRYCATHNVNWGEREGLSIGALTAAISGDIEENGALTSREKAAVRWADVVANGSAKGDEAAYARLREHFDSSEIVMLTLTIAYRAMVNRFVDALQVELEDAAVAACPIDVG